MYEIRIVYVTGYYATSVKHQELDLETLLHMLR